MQNFVSNSLITGDLRLHIFKLAWPTMFAMVFETLFNLIDAFWVSKLGANALAAVSCSSFILWMVYSIATISATGITAKVSQSIGAGNSKEARFVASQGIILAFISGLIIAIIVNPMLKLLFRIMELTIQVQSLASDYLWIYLTGICFAFTYISMEAIFRASGDTKTPMAILGFGLLLNAILDPLLILGMFGFPALGVKGAAIATIFSYIVANLIIFILLQKRKLLPILNKFTWLKLDFKVIISIIKIGSPVAISGVSFSLVYIFLTRIISYFGAPSLAALGMGHRLEGIAYLTSVGFSIAAATIVGQNIGADEPERAIRGAWIATFYASILMGIFSLIAIFLAPQIISLFINDKEVISIGSQYLFIISTCEVFLAFEVVMEGAFSGMGNTIPPMLVSIPITALRIPAAYLFAIVLGGGTIAIWTVITISTLLKGLILVIWFSKTVPQNLHKSIVGNKDL